MGDGLNSFARCRVQARYLVRCEASILYEQVAKRIANIIDIDYECNNYMDEWNFENWGIKYWSKTPEFIDYMEQH